MRTLTPAEQSALQIIARRGSYCPGDLSGKGAFELRAALNGLVRKKRAIAISTDDGPRYSLTAQGEIDAA